MSDLTDFLLARIAEDEAAARAVPPLERNTDMGGNRQLERFVFARTLPSSADGRGNWSPHKDSPATEAHFSRHDPVRVLRECEAKREVIAHYEAYAREAERHPDVFAIVKMCDAAEGIVVELAKVYADHPDFRENWRP